MSFAARSAPEPALHRIVTVSVENLFFFRFSFSLAYIRLFTALSIRYGKYCGIGHSGCPGEEPCDDLDACCMVHDSCVGAKGMTNISCHKKFQKCVNRLSKSIKQSKNKKVGFSKQCPYSVVIPTVNQGMDIGIMFSQLGNDMRTEL
ncbi:phospholipase A2-beta isoform X1 [Brassica rapa]|uniref:phospholipase A2-beta isoform X1 n=1 Tax=Brassica campestris TaxID=3711 RepID=UPI00142DB2C4|nr:phospholipase A2-beta isoform X1 [Brassica rapa]XP_048593113.1 phospholipase A2-beta-like isoform X1 [Brassica napus]